MDVWLSTSTGAVLVAVAILASAASPAGAQGLPLLKEGTGVWVTLRDGTQQQGTVAAASSSELLLRIGLSNWSIAVTEIRRVEGRDGLGNGVRNGGLVGAAALGGFGVLLSYGFCDIPDSCLANDLGPIALLAGIGAGVGMGLGALIDREIEGRQLLYASRGTTFTLHVTPTLSAHGFGASGVIAW